MEFAERDSCNSLQSSGNIVAVDRKPEVVILLLPPYLSYNSKLKVDNSNVHLYCIYVFTSVS